MIFIVWQKVSHDFTNVNQVVASGKKILILAPHEDDEALMCSGVITHALKNGADVSVVVITNGDNKGRKIGLIRIRETIEAMEFLGLSAEKVIFMGYGNIKREKDRFLNLLYNAVTDNTLVPSRIGTASYSIPETPEYHYQKHGVHARYDRATFRTDLESLIQEFNPDHIFVSSLYDTHPDHVALYRFTVESIINVKRNNPKFAPVLHEYLIHPHELDDYWPNRDCDNGPLNPFSKPAGFEEQTGLDWDKREVFSVPLEMQTIPHSKNKKYLAISKYRSQRPAGNHNYLYSYVKSDEFFWTKDFSNIALLARVSTSSENATTNQLGVKAIDGITDGYPRFPANEWVTVNETAGAWIQLSWHKAYRINKIILYDRPVAGYHITAATLTFSDGSILKVGTLPDNGSGYEIHFLEKTVEWVKLTIDAATGDSAGLSEFEVYEAPEEENIEPSSLKG
ncbi:MAG: putative LmbE-like protein [Firmicutes bacterium]|nr:putative LmbE-like protein [Bacillota bacterium]